MLLGTTGVAQQLDSNATAPISSEATAGDWFDNACQSCGSVGDSDCGSASCRRIFDQKYLSVFGGFTDIDNFERILRTPVGRTIDGAKLRSGYVAGVALGGVIKEFVRNEMEFTYRDNSASSFFNQQFNTTGLLLAEAREPATGFVNSYSAMYNAVFDVGKRCVGLPHLYVGGGLGSIYVDGDFSTAADIYSVQDSSFAYQFIGGINYPVRSTVDLYTEYRFLGADNVRVENVTTGVSLGDFAYDSHSVLFGLRFRR
jgi:opacity protein-like surface antigen